MELLLDSAGIACTLDRMAVDIAQELGDHARPAVVGIRSRGEVLARRLVKLLEARGLRDIAYGCLDITLYRDDLAEIGPRAIVRKTEIEFDVSDRVIVLVDDVLFTGRSVRSAIDALVDLGRPKAIRLVVLVDRGGRELPIQADWVGVKSEDPKRHVKVLLTEVDGRDAVEVE